jgi:uncharacterized protein
MNNKSVSTATIGYMCYALSFWLVGVYVAGWLHGSAGPIWAISFPLVVLLLIVGILALTNERTLDSVIFLSGAALIWSSHSLVGLEGAHDAPSAGFSGWFWIVWAAFFAWVFVAALKSGGTRMLFLLGVALTYLAFAISEWSGAHVIEIVSGYLALATALLAAVVSADAINGHGRAGHLSEGRAGPGSG